MPFAALDLHKKIVEATTNTRPVVSLLAPFVESVIVSNPMAIRAISHAKVKTDKVDALDWRRFANGEARWKRRAGGPAPRPARRLLPPYS